MKIAVLSRNPRLYSTRRLVEAGQLRGHEMVVIDTLRAYMNIASHKPQIHYRGKPLEGFDAVIPRIGASVTRYGCAVLRQFELMGSYTPNSAAAIVATVPRTVMMSGVSPVASRALPMGAVTFDTDARPRMLSISPSPPRCRATVRATCRPAAHGYHAAIAE